MYNSKFPTDIQAWYNAWREIEETIINNLKQKKMEVTKQRLMEAYRAADANGKTMLENLYGKEHFLSITERVKSYEDACRVLGIQPEKEPFAIQSDPFGDLKASAAFRKLSVIARALNEGWKPDWSNGNQCKYYPRFFEKTPGSGLSFVDYDFWCTSSCVGSRLCYKSAELAEYAAKQWPTLYNDYLTIKQ